jgi:hypothetical protein
MVWHFPLDVQGLEAWQKIPLLVDVVKLSRVAFHFQLITGAKVVVVNFGPLALYSFPLRP